MLGLNKIRMHLCLQRGNLILRVMKWYLLFPMVKEKDLSLWTQSERTKSDKFHMMKEEFLSEEEFAADATGTTSRIILWWFSMRSLSWPLSLWQLFSSCCSTVTLKNMNYSKFTSRNSLISLESTLSSTSPVSWRIFLEWLFFLLLTMIVLWTLYMPPWWECGTLESLLRSSSTSRWFTMKFSKKPCRNNFPFCNQWVKSSLQWFK